MEFQVKSEVINVNVATVSQLWKTVTEKFRSGDGFTLATINLDHLVKLSGSQSFRTAYAQQDLIVADGNPIVWLSRLARKSVALMPGSELILPMAQLAAQEHIKLALIGSTDAALQKAALGLRKQVPDLEIVLCIAPSLGFDPTGPEATAILTELANSAAGLCFIALGAPKQEVFAVYGRRVVPSMGFVSIGAGLDFIAGDQIRAPKWVRALAMEWLWRMLSSPMRLGPRYVRCILILPKLVISALRLRFKG